MAVRKKRGPKHPGVVLMKPDEAARSGWRARYVDPESGRTIKISLDVDCARRGVPALTTVEQRDDWAAKKSRELAKRRLELAEGAPKVESGSLALAVDGYFEAAENRLGSSTIALYRAAADLLLDWARHREIVTTDMLRPTALPGFRDFLLAQRKKAYVKGRGRGARRAGTAKLSPRTVNWQLRAVKTILNDLRIRGMVPLTSDAIADGLKAVDEPIEAPEFLRPVECQRALAAALWHDAETFKITRAENAGDLPAGSTPRYRPIAPFVAFTLLTGMRLSEVLAVRWAYVDLEALDADGRLVGEIRLPASVTKTKRARTVGLDVSPSVRELLAAMKLNAGRVKPSAFVFGAAEPTPESTIESARRRLVEKYGAPSNFSAQLLRSTCATYMNNAPSIYGGAASFISAKRLGHSVAVSEKHYAGQFNGVSRDARTLEAAMQIESLTAKVVASIGGAAGQRDVLADVG